MPSLVGSLSLRSFMEKWAAPRKPPAPPSLPETWKVPSTPKRQEELAMWKTWKDGGEQPEHMEPLLKSLQPLVHNKLKQFIGVPIHKEVLRSEANRLVINGLQKFDPARAQMHTFLTNELKGISRYVVKNQNLSRVVEERAHRIGDYQRSYAVLREQMDREPTQQEIADHMLVPLKMVKNLQVEMRDDVLASGALEDPFINETPRSREVLKLLKFELNPTETAVFEYLTGDGKPKTTSTGVIAKKLGWSDSKVAQTKSSIAKKAKLYL